MLNKKIIIVFVSILTCSSLFAQSMSGLKCGKLPNGMTYYIKNSQLQRGKVSFQLVQNVGAILEEDNENGLAHFLEHMAFNGTKTFPSGVMPYLKGKGVYTFNAMTGIDDTTYEILNIPTDDCGLVDSCLLIIKDWCDAILLNSSDIDNERGVILEERRGRAGVDMRMQEATVPVVYNFSKYAERNIIGSVDILENFAYATLRDFYSKWYRPDLQALIIVGDINEEEFEQRVKELFGAIKPKANVPVRYSVEIKDNEKPLYKLILESENKVRSVTVYQRVAKLKDLSSQQRRQYSMSAKIFNSVLRERLSELKNRNAEEFLSVSALFDNFIGDYNAFTIEITPLKNRDKAAFEQVMTILEEMRRYGITEQEMTRTQEQIFQSLKDFERNMDKTTNSYYTNTFKNNFLRGAEVLDQREEIMVSKEVLLDMDADDVNRWIKSWDNNTNLSMVIYGNENNYPYVTESEFNDIIKSIKDRDIAQVERKREKIDFFSNDLKPVAIKKIKPIKKFEAEEWILENGVRVIYKYTEEGRGTFAMASSSHGGRSVVKDEDLPSLTAMESLVLKSGIANYDREAVRNIVSGKNMNISFLLSEFTEGIGGSTLTENAEMFFKFNYLMFTAPRFTEEMFNKYVQQSRFIFENTPKTPMDIVSDSIRALSTISSPRTRKIDLEYIDDMKFEKLEQLYRERLANISQFTFCVVGDIEREVAMDLVCRYIGNIPSAKAKKEKYIVRDYSKKTADITKVFTAELPDNKALVDISYNNEIKMNDKEQLAFTIYGAILSNRFFELVREQQSGTYGVNADTHYSNFPKRESAVRVNFETEGTKADMLKNIIFDELKRSTEVPYSPEVVNQVVISLKRNKAMADENMDIQFWMKVLNYYVEYDVDITSPENFEDIIDKITSEDIMKIAKRFFKSATIKDILVKSE